MVVEHGDPSPFAPVRLVPTFLASPPPADWQRTAPMARAEGTAGGKQPRWAGAFLSVVPGHGDFVRTRR
jgi:hypothetical protein